MPFKQLTPAEKLLQKLGIDNPQKIDLEVIAMHTGAIIKFRELHGCEARILGKGEKAIISVDSRVHPFRQRFSIGHELGHWHFHKGRNFICRSEDIGNGAKSIVDPERVADDYSANLLMPRPLFVPASISLHTNFQSIRQLAKMFRCSLSATAIRMVECGPEPAMLICHSPQGRKWFRSHKNIPEKWFPKKQLDRESYVYDVQFGKERECKRGPITANTWFDRDAAYGYEVYEEAITASNNESLILITFNNDGMLEE